jgi:hypothetical protein
MYAGVDPLTGKRLYLTESTTDEAEARRIGQPHRVLTAIPDHDERKEVSSDARTSPRSPAGRVPQRLLGRLLQALRKGMV